MSQRRARALVVTDQRGMRGVIDETELRHNDGQVLVQLENGRQAFVPVEELRQQPDGMLTLPFSFSELAGDGDGGRSARPLSREAGRGDERVVVPVVEEQLQVEKRKVEAGGVRIRKVVHEREEVIDEPLMREEVQVKRVPVNRVVEAPIPVRHVGNTMIISLLEEVLVVEKRLMLKEELHITKSETETYKPQRITLRREEAMVERVETSEPRPKDETTRGRFDERDDY